MKFSYGMMFLVLMFCFAAAILGDSTTEALLLAHFDTRIVASMFLFNAAFLFLISGMIIPVIDRIDRGILFQTALLVHVSILIVIRFLLYLNLEFLYPFLYSYAYITKLLFFLLFWTLVNDLVDSRKAAGLFPRLAAGGTLGAIGISFFITWFMNFFQVQNLFYIWSALVFCVYLLFIPVKKRSSGIHFKVNRDRIDPQVKSINSLLDGIKLLKMEPMLGHMSFLYGLIFFLLVIQQFYFYSQIKTALSEASQVASFLGCFNGVSMTVTIILQLMIAGKVISRLGSTRSMLLLPVILVFNYIAMLLISAGISPGAISLFGVTVVGMGLRVAFFDSFFSPNFQIFFSSLPQEFRGRGKLCIEGIIKPVSIIIAGIWIIRVMPVITDRINFYILAVLSCIAIFESWRLRSKYTESLIMYFSGYVGKRSNILFKQLKVSGEPNFSAMVNEKLKNEDFVVKKFIIEFLADSATDEAVSILDENLGNRDPRVRASVLVALGKLKIEKSKKHIIACLSDPDQRVIANAVSALCRYKDPSLKKYIEPFMNSHHRRVRSDAMIALWPFSDAKKKESILNELEHELFDSSSTPARISSNLYVLGEIDGRRSLKILNQYHLCNKCGYDNQMVFDQMVNALSKKNDISAMHTLLEIAVDSGRKRQMVIKGKIAHFFKMNPEVILGFLNEKSCLKRNLIIQAVSEMPEDLIKKIRPELKEIASEEMFQLKRNMDVFSKVSGYKGTELFCYSLMEEYIETEIKSLLFIASLIDKSMKLKTCILQVFNKDAYARANAFEMMNNTGFLKLNRLIIKMMEKKERLLSMVNHSEIPEPKLYSIIKRFIDYENRWVAKCADFSLHKFAEYVSQSGDSGLLNLN